ncbi:MAG: tetratricopeptide repeat-containing sensor histidine kinase [Polaribacter sp.]
MYKKIRLFCCVIILSIGHFSMAQNDIEKTLKRIDSLKGINITKSIALADSLIKKKNLSIIERIKTHISLGNIYKIKKEYTTAQQYFKKAEKEVINTKDYKLKADILIGLADILERRALYQEAINQLLLAKQIALENQNKLQEAKINSSIAHIYYNLKQLDKSISYLKLSEAIFKELNSAKDLSKLYNNIGILYKIKGDHTNAITAFNNAIKESFFINDEIGAAFTQTNLGYLYILENDLVLAEKNLLSASQIFTDQQIQNAVLYTNLSKLYFKKNNLNKAIDFSEKALALHTKDSIRNEMMQNHELLSQLFEAKKEHSKALSHYKSFKDLEAEIFSNTKKEQVAALENKLQLQEQEHQINVLEKENRLRLFLIIVLVILFLSGGIIWYLYSKGKQSKVETKRLILEQKLLQSQLNPHFVFNVLSSIQSFMLDNNTSEASNYLVKFSKLIRRILEHSRKDFIPFEEDLEIIKNYLELQQLRLNNKFDFNFEIDNHLLSNTYFIPPMLIQPFIENAVEHGVKSLKNRKGLITLHYTLKANYLELIVLDNGVGLKNRPKDSKKESLSTQIIKERLNAISIDNNSVKYKVTLMERIEETGIKVVVEIPYKTSLN